MPSKKTEIIMLMLIFLGVAFLFPFCTTKKINKTQHNPVDAAQEQAKVLKQDIPLPSAANQHPDAQWFSKAGLGLFIHWGIAAVQAKGDLSWCMMANKSWYDATVTPNEYYASVKDWNPEKMNFDNMLAKAKAAGFEYAVFVTKHHDGFTLWPSAFGSIGTKYSFNSRDFVKEFVDACRKHQLKVGLYYSPPDWWLERDYKNWSLSEHAVLDMNHQPKQPTPFPAGFAEKHKLLVQGQVKELLTRYGKIDLMWFDGGSAEIANDVVRTLQPGIVINSRNGKGDYGHDEGRLPQKQFAGWFESCVPCWPKRMWSYREPTDYGGYDAATTLSMLVMLRAWGGNLLANVGPKENGSLPDYVPSCWKEMAEWMIANKESVADVTTGPWPQHVNMPVTIKDNVAYVHFLPQLPERITNIPPKERDFTYTKQVVPNLPAYSDSVVWKNISRPEKVVLLRNGKEIPFTYNDGTLTIVIPHALRSMNPDVVKLFFKEVNL